MRKKSPGKETTKKHIKNKYLYDAAKSVPPGSIYAFAQKLGISAQSLHNMIYRNKKPVAWEIAELSESLTQGEYTALKMMEWPKN